MEYDVCSSDRKYLKKMRQHSIQNNKLRLNIMNVKVIEKELKRQT